MGEFVVPAAVEEVLLVGSPGHHDVILAHGAHDALAFGHGPDDAVGAAARGGRLVQADLDLDGDDAGQDSALDRGAQAAVGAGDGQGHQQMGGALDVEIGEELRGFRPDPVERGQIREEREQDLRPAHGLGGV